MSAAEVEYLLKQINDVVNQNIEILRKLKELTNENSDMNILIDVTRTEYKALKKKFNLPETDDTAADTENNLTESVQVIEESDPK